MNAEHDRTDVSDTNFRLMRERMFRGDSSLMGDFAVTTQNKFDSIEFIQRMIAAYQKANDANPDAGVSMWSGFMDQHNRHVHQSLLDGDVDAVAMIWGNPSETDVFYGFEGDMCVDGPKTAVCSDPFAGTMHAVRSYDGLRRLAEAMGAIRMENIEVPEDQRPPNPSVDQIIAAIDSSLGRSIVFPNPYSGEYGLATARGVVGYRTIQALYQAWRVNAELTHLNGKSVVEIGAGLGRSVYHTYMMGVRDYTAVDLPFTCLSQAHFLAATIGPENIALFGEDDQNRPIRIIPPSAFFASNTRYDLAVNFDSLTEIDQTMARQYVKGITERCNGFISVNHEFNPVRVCELFADIGIWPRQSRNAYWMRKSYVEEFFAPDPYKELHAFRNSTSWRITAPLRKIMSRLRG